MRWVSARALVAGLVGVAATLIGLAAPAQAAACTKGTGVTVVVGSSVSCDSGAHSPASSNFAAVGHTLKYAARQPGFVCRVDGAPASDPCVSASPSNAYWGLFWSDGKSGSWTYSNSGVGNLRVPRGGWVAFVFQDGGRKSPGVRPIGPTPKPRPTTAKPTTSKPTSAKPSATPSSKASDEAKKSDKKKATDSATSATPGADQTSAAGADDSELRSTAADVDDSSSAAPLWIAAVLGVGLVAAAVVIARARSQRS